MSSRLLRFHRLCLSFLLWDPSPFFCDNPQFHPSHDGINLNKTGRNAQLHRTPHQKWIQRSENRGVQRGVVGLDAKQCSCLWFGQHMIIIMNTLTCLGVVRPSLGSLSLSSKICMAASLSTSTATAAVHNTGFGETGLNRWCLRGHTEAIFSITY